MAFCVNTGYFCVLECDTGVKRRQQRDRDIVDVRVVDHDRAVHRDLE